jgi:hypothetical protein
MLDFISYLDFDGFIKTKYFILNPKNFEQKWTTVLVSYETNEIVFKCVFGIYHNWTMTIEYSLDNFDELLSRAYKYTFESILQIKG